MKMDSILIFAPSWIGDSVMSLGAMRAVRKAHPNARLVVLTRPWVQELYAGCDVVDETILYDPHGADRGVSGFLRAARRVRVACFDVSILFPNAVRAAFLIYAAGIPERWGYATEKRGLFLTKRVPPAPRPFGRHQAHFYLDLLGGLGLRVAEPDLSLRATEEMRRAGGALLEREGFKGGPLVGVHPGPRIAARRCGRLRATPKSRRSSPRRGTAKSSFSAASPRAFWRKKFEPGFPRNGF